MAFAAQQSGMTLRELALAVASEVSVARLVGAGANCVVELPTGATLTRVLTACRNAWARFVMEDSGWSFLTDTVALTLSPDGSGASCIAGDAGRYRLPNTIRSAPVGDWTLSFATGQVWKVRSTSPALVAERRAASAGASAPVVAAVRSLANPDDANGGAAWEVIIAPTPDMAYTMQATFRQHTEWSELDARHIAGGEHDYTLTRLAVWEYKRRDVLPLAERAGLAKEAEQLVAKSRALDMGRRPTLLGTAPQTAATYDDFPGNVQERTAGSFIPPTGV